MVGLMETLDLKINTCSISNGNSSFLEENSSDILLFGDVIYIMQTNDKYINLDISSYGEIFSLTCGGFETVKHNKNHCSCCWFQ